MPPDVFYIGRYLSPGAVPDNQLEIYYGPQAENDICNIASGALPPGVVFRQKTSPHLGCTLVGVPTQVGRFTYTLKIENLRGSDTVTYTTRIEEPPSSIEILNTSFPQATVGEPYLASVVVRTTGNNWK